MALLGISEFNSNECSSRLLERSGRICYLSQFCSAVGDRKLRNKFTHKLPADIAQTLMKAHGYEAVTELTAETGS